MNYEEICQYVFKEEGLDWQLRISKRRDDDLKTARQIAMYLGNVFYPEITWSDLARVFSKDHATAIHSVKVINNRMDVDKRFVEKIVNYKKHIKGIADSVRDSKDAELLTDSVGLIHTTLLELTSRMRIIALAYCQLTNNKIVPNENQDQTSKTEL